MWRRCPAALGSPRLPSAPRARLPSVRTMRRRAAACLRALCLLLHLRAAGERGRPRPDGGAGGTAVGTHLRPAAHLLGGRRDAGGGGCPGPAGGRPGPEPACPGGGGSARQHRGQRRPRAGGRAPRCAPRGAAALRPRIARTWPGATAARGNRDSLYSFFLFCLFIYF